MLHAQGVVPATDLDELFLAYSKVVLASMCAITGNLNCVTCVMVMVIRWVPGNRVIAAVNATWTNASKTWQLQWRAFMMQSLDPIR